MARDKQAAAAGDLLKSTEVARLLRVHPKQVYRLIDQGLPGRRVGSEWRFLRDEVLAWSAQRERGATTTTTLLPPSPIVSSTLSGAAITVAAPPPLLAANGDIVVEVLLAALGSAGKPLLGFVQADARTAVSHLAAGAVLLAGFHGQPPPSHLAADRLARVHLVRREVGLAHPRRRTLRGVADLAGKRLATRPAGAGVRAHLDRALERAGESLASLGIEAEAREVDSHRDAVCAVVRGEADAALTTSAWAARLGLAFHCLATEPYDLLLHAPHLGRAECVAVCEVAQSRAFREALGAIPGYDPREAGEIRYHPAE